MKFPLQRLLLPFAIVSLIIGLWAGLIRIGWDFSWTAMAPYHGALMIGSFLGTLIILERAITLKSNWVMLAPLINVLSLPLFLSGYIDAALFCLIAGGSGMTLIFIIISYRHPNLYNYLLLSGALCYLAGNIVLNETRLFPEAYPWWMAFFFLTIIGERVELSRFLNISKHKQYLLTGFLGLFVIGILFPFHGPGRYILAISLAASAIWLLKYDMALKSVKSTGQFRFTGSLLLIGYMWLLITAVMAFFVSSSLWTYDAFLHSFFLGFVFAMIFAHAPIILPPVLAINKKIYHPILFIWFGLLQVSLITRIISDFLENAFCQRWSGLFNGIAILLFFVNVLVLLKFGNRK